jgi:O-antigen/teichoic acid export membrane protein
MSEPESHPVEAAVVAKRARRGISWNLVGAVSTNTMRVVVIAVLGRALTSADFGIVAAALSVNVILFSIRDVGVGQALVQRKELDDGHVETAFALSLYLGLALAVVLLAAAPWIADLYDIPEATDVMRALGLLFAFRGLSATSRVLCQRELRFRAIASIDAVSFAVGSVVSIGCALAHLGPWSLVLGYLAEETLSMVLYLTVRPPRFSLAVRGDRLRDLMTFGVGQTVAQVAGILATYGDNLVVGNVLGARALGFYTRAYELIKFPSTVFASVVGSVLFPAFSRLQGQREQLAIGLRRATMANATLLLPVSALLVVLAPETIRILVGPGWDDAVLPFQVLAISMLLRTHQKLGALVAQAAGAVNAVALSYVVYLLFVVGGAVFAIRWGIAGVAASTSIAIAVVALEVMYLAMRVSGATRSEIVRAHGLGLGLAAVAFVVAWPLAAGLRAAGAPAFAVFAVVATVVAAACTGALVWRLRTAEGDLLWLRSELGRLVRVGRRRRDRMNAATATSIE